MTRPAGDIVWLREKEYGDLLNGTPPMFIAR
jgi:hypothetical protein